MRKLHPFDLKTFLLCVCEKCCAANPQRAQLRAQMKNTHYLQELRRKRRHRAKRRVAA